MFQYSTDRQNEKKKIVVAPDIWYKTGKHAKADLYQDDWKLIHIG